MSSGEFFKPDESFVVSENIENAATAPIESDVLLAQVLLLIFEEEESLDKIISDLSGDRIVN